MAEHNASGFPSLFGQSFDETLEEELNAFRSIEGDAHPSEDPDADEKLRLERLARSRYMKAYRAEKKEQHLKLLSIVEDSWANPKLVKAKLGGKPVGFRAFRVKADGDVVNMPLEYNQILSACEHLIDNKQRFPELLERGGFGINRKDTRRNIARVLAVLLARCQLLEGRISETPTSEGLRTISQSTLIGDYILRFGEYIAPSSFSTAFNYLIRAGYIETKNVVVQVQKGNELVLRSAAAYKMFTGSFFRDLKVTAYPNVAKNIIRTRKKDIKKGFSFAWKSIERLTQGFAKCIEGIALNNRTVPPVELHAELAFKSIQHVH